jgi:uncharacterized protein YecE (DUF72 family)
MIRLKCCHGYKLYKADVLKGWAEKVNNPKFKFCLKAHRGMSFLRDTPTRRDLTTAFIANIMGFRHNLGPVFITHNGRVKWEAQVKRLLQIFGNFATRSDFFC